MKVDYETDASGAFALSVTTIDPRPANSADPRLGGQIPFGDTSTDYSAFTSLTFDLRNTSGRPLVFAGVLLQGADGEWYRPQMAGARGAVATLPSKEEWQTLRLDLTRLETLDGVEVQGAQALKQVQNIQLLFYDVTAPGQSRGALWLDNFMFGR